MGESSCHVSTGVEDHRVRHVKESSREKGGHVQPHEHSCAHGAAQFLLGGESDLDQLHHSLLRCLNGLGVGQGSVEGRRSIRQQLQRFLLRVSRGSGEVELEERRDVSAQLGRSFLDELVLPLLECGLALLLAGKRSAERRVLGTRGCSCAESVAMKVRGGGGGGGGVNGDVVQVR